MGWIQGDNLGARKLLRFLWRNPNPAAAGLVESGEVILSSALRSLWGGVVAHVQRAAPVQRPLKVQYYFFLRNIYLFIYFFL